MRPLCGARIQLECWLRAVCCYKTSVDRILVTCLW
jgi:hypothetical protein